MVATWCQLAVGTLKGASRTSWISMAVFNTDATHACRRRVAKPDKLCEWSYIWHSYDIVHASILLCCWFLPVGGNFHYKQLTCCRMVWTHMQSQSHAFDTLRMACEGQQWALQQTCQFLCLQMASVPSCEPVVHAIHFTSSQNCLQRTGLHMFQAWRFSRHKLICACDFCTSHMAGWLADITPTKGEGHSPQRWLPNFERKFPLQGYKLQRLSIDVPLQRQGMCVPEDQSKHCSTCCIGHQLPIWLHSQSFWSLIVWTVSASDKHLTWFTMQLFPLGSNVMFLSVLSDLNKTCWLKHFKTNKLVEYAVTSYANVGFFTTKFGLSCSPEQHWTTFLVQSHHSSQSLSVDYPAESKRQQMWQMCKGIKPARDPFKRSGSRDSV